MQCDIIICLIFTFFGDLRYLELIVVMPVDIKHGGYEGTHKSGVTRMNIIV